MFIKNTMRHSPNNWGIIYWCVVSLIGTTGLYQHFIHWQGQTNLFLVVCCGNEDDWFKWELRLMRSRQEETYSRSVPVTLAGSTHLWRDLRCLWRVNITVPTVNILHSSSQTCCFRDKWCWDADQSSFVLSCRLACLSVCSDLCPALV